MSVLTKQAIFASFLKFLQEKPLDKITVKDIVDDCGINRKTFYYYFSDIYAMAEELFRARLENLRKEFPPEEYSWNDIIEKTGEYMYENKKVTLHVFRSVGYEKMHDLILLPHKSSQHSTEMRKKKSAFLPNQNATPAGKLRLIFVW